MKATVEERRLYASVIAKAWKDEAFKEFMDYIHWRGDARLVREYINKSGDTIDWLENMGVQFADISTYFQGGNQTWHLVKPEKANRGPGRRAQ